MKKSKKKVKAMCALIILIIFYLIIVNSPLNYTFEENSSGYTVTGQRIWFPFILVPNGYNSEKVTIVGAGAFEWNEILIAYIPDSVVLIEDGAFANNKKMFYVYIGNSVEKIGVDAFAYCTRLKNVRMSSKIKNIDNLAFEECYKLKGLDFPEGLIRIGACAFTGCDFTEICFPESLLEIGDKAFKNCNKLSDVSFKSTNTIYSENTFEGTLWYEQVYYDALISK
ncbi:MAG: leucine-rich repeat domain-containing protein [Ruminococcus sp.]|jgi:hypothetical protein|nr:leucine-rich repeat domain-containing protein [Ruminococcus sp.]